MRFVIIENSDSSDRGAYGIVVIEGNTSVEEVEEIVYSSYDTEEIKENLPSDCWLAEDFYTIWW